ncbi:hypothetical protein BU24DRAFT_421138 [Aaosphaeria arxii CBS 175.79]|uniref:Uncharacterized protein n=1 Tax=Aaosphaeria arxii CBS 175.79 TaxID=1450172 RepID=A0A6A5XYU3_9PLEO|nr:uncharacterized protein BU24DRAFT_421138 [Aaosphaeria arxii CBS 175.79]KAF2018139.1 hypothetical protein BU24DRAFT_421138 [Aaosphaeria arxii CBS 175.79]
MAASESESQDQSLIHQARCHKREDDTGFLNIFKAWFWYPLHLACCIGFVILMLYAIDGQDFGTGSPPSLGDRAQGFGLYQTEVNGFISVALVLMRLLASCSAALLVWRLIYILLEKSGLTIAELCRLANLKVPIVPRLDSRHNFHWTCFAAIMTLLLWPPSFAAPLANSSLNWIPSTRVSPEPGQSFKFPIYDRQHPDRGGFIYPHIVTPAILKASLMVSQDPDYAFIALNKSQVPLKRYIYDSSPPLNDSGICNIMLPYFKVTGIQWLDAPEGVDIWNLDNSSMLDNNPNPGQFAGVGTLGFFTETKWNAGQAIESYKAHESETFEGKRNISIFVGEVNVGKPLKDGSIPTIDTPCSSYGDILGELPSVSQASVNIYFNKKWMAKRCYMLAEVNMKAGAYPNRRVNIKRVGFSNKMSMAVPIDGPADLDPVLSPDNAILPVLDIMSDVTRMITYMDLTPGWQKNNSIDNYVSGMLTTAYHATWSAMPTQNATETVSITPLEPVIQARVNRGRLYIWLAMNSTLTIAGIILAAVLKLAGEAKIIRDTTLAAMTLDLKYIAHEGNNGLCNAVGLNKDDRALGRVKWSNDVDPEINGSDGEKYGYRCCKDLVFVDKK